MSTDAPTPDAPTPVTVPSFDPPLEPDQQAQFDDVLSAIAANNAKYGNRWLLLFVKSGLISPNIPPLPNGSPTPSSPPNLHPNHFPLCSVSTLVAVAFNAAEIPTVQYKLDFSDKPAWYTQLQGQSEWNNKGQCPGGYLAGEWLTDSDTFYVKMKDHFPESFKQIDVPTPDLPPSVTAANPFFSCFPRMTGEKDVEADLDATYFAPLNSYFAANPTSKFLGGATLSLSDAKLAYMLAMINMVLLHFDGESPILQKHTHVYRYLRDFFDTDELQCATDHVHIPPAALFGELRTSFERMGMTLAASSLPAGQELPIDCTFTYYSYNTPTTVPTATVPTATVPTATVPTATVPSATVPSATVLTATVPAFDPPLTPADQKRFDDVLSVIAANNSRYGDKWLLLFVGAAPIPANAAPLPNGSPPPSSPPSLHPNHFPLCSMTALVSIAYYAAGIPTVMYKIDYEDKPAWYTQLQGQTEWNNKGQFPGGYLCGEWLTDSDTFYVKMEQHFPESYAQIDVPAPDLPPSVIAANPFFACIPHMTGKQDVRAELDATYFAPLNAWFAANPTSKFLGGATLSLSDAKLAYMLALANMVLLHFDGESPISQEHTHVYRYLRDFFDTDELQCATDYLHIPPATLFGKLKTSFEKMGMTLAASSLPAGLELPIDCTFTYYSYKTPTTVPTFDPPLTPADQKRFDDVLSVIAANNLRYGTSWCLMFIGALPIHPDYIPIPNGVPNHDSPMQLHPNHFLMCGMSTWVATAYNAADVPVVMYKIDYDDIPRWYKQMQGQPEWNNKGQFPGGYLHGEWLTESELFITRLEQHFPANFAVISAPPIDLPPSVTAANPFFMIIPHIKGEDDVRQSFDDSILAPLNSYFAANPTSKFLGGATLSLADARFAYFLAMANLLAFYFDGESLIPRTYTHVYAYLSRFYASEPFRRATHYTYLPPAANLAKLLSSFKKMGMAPRTPAHKCDLDLSDAKTPAVTCLAALPIDSPFTYYNLASPSPSSPSPSLPTFDPPLSRSGLSKFSEVAALIDANKSKYGDRFLILFMGAIEIPNKPSQPSPEFDNNPLLHSFCGYSAMVGATFAASDIPVSIYKVSYDDIPEWYSTMSDQPEWNNQKQFPGAFFNDEWLTESEIIVERLQTAYPDAYSLSHPTPPPSPIPSIYATNVFFKLFPHILGTEDLRQSLVADIIQPLDAHLSSPDFPFLAGATFTNADARFSYFVLIVNAMLLHLDGESFVPASCTSFYAYLTRCAAAHPALVVKTFNQSVHPSAVIEAFNKIITNKGMEIKKAAAPVTDLPFDSMTAYYNFNVELAFPYISPAFEPVLNSADQAKFDKVEAHIASLNRRYQDQEYMLIFIGAWDESMVSRELTSKLEPGHPADGPLPFDSHPDATAICAMSTLVAMSATAMKVPISFYKINYEDKDAWFTSMSGNEDWNNIGQVPSVYVKGQWITDSDVIMERLGELFPEQYPSIDCPIPEPLAGILSSNVLFRVMPHISGAADVRESLVADVFDLLEEYFKDSPHDFIASPTPSVLDTKFAYFLAMVNMLILYYEGTSGVPATHTHIYAYLNKFYASDAYIVGLNYGKPHPTLNLQKLFASLKKMGMESKPSFLTMYQVPADGDTKYYSFDAPPSCFKLPAFKTIPGTSIANEPFRSLRELCGRGKGFAMFFVASVDPKLSHGATASNGSSSEPLQYISDAGKVRLLPACGVTGAAAMACSAAGIPVYLFAFDHELRPAWLTALDVGVHEEWGNEGTGASALLFSTENGFEESTWVTGAEKIIGALESKFPTSFKSLQKRSTLCPKSVYSNNMLDENAKKPVDMAVFRAVEEYLEKTGSEFLNGGALGLADCRFAFGAMMCNIVSLHFEGRSAVGRKSGKLWAYLERVERSKEYAEATGYMRTPGGVLVERMGRGKREARVRLDAIPADAGWKYYDLSADISKTRKKVLALPPVKGPRRMSGPPVVLHKLVVERMKVEPTVVELPLALEEKERGSFRSLRRLRKKFNPAGPIYPARHIDGDRCESMEQGEHDEKAPRVDRASMKSQTKRSGRVNLAKNWYWLLLDASWSTLAKVIVVVYVAVTLLFSLMTLPYIGEIHGREDWDGGSFETAFVFILTNLLSIGLGTFEPSGRATQFITLATYFTGVIINVLMFSIVVTKFQRPQAEIVFSKSALFTSRNHVPFFVFRVGNLRGNLLYYPRCVVTLQTPISTPEGESIMRMDNIDLTTMPSTVSGSMTFAHLIDESSPLKQITSEGKLHGIEEGSMTFSVSFSGIDATYHSEIVSSKKYFVKDLQFGYRYNDIMEIEDGMGVVNWKRFDSLVQIDCSTAYVNMVRAMTQKLQKLSLEKRAGRSSRRTLARFLAVAENDGESSGGDEHDETDERHEEIELCHHEKEPPMHVKKSGMLVLFPSCSVGGGGEVVPVCTFSLTVGLAYWACGVPVKIWGRVGAAKPPWMRGVSWHTHEQNDHVEPRAGEGAEKFFKALATPKHSRIKAWEGAGGKTEYLMGVLGCVGGEFLKGHEVLLFHLRGICGEAAWAQFDCKSERRAAVEQVHSELVAGINLYIRLGTVAAQDKSRGDLEMVLDKLEGLLGEWGVEKGTGKGVAREGSLHYLDCVLAPVVHRAVQLLAHFDDVEGGERGRIEAYMEEVMGRTEWQKSTGVDAEMLAAGYLEFMKENLGKGVRKKKERDSRATMICI